MPTYQYACLDPECGDRFELVQSFTDPAASACPVCGGPVRKVFSAVGVVFKGSGFYRTDSREAANGAAAKKDSGSSSTKSEPSAPAKASESSSGSSDSGSGSAAASSGSTGGSSSSGSSSSSAVAAAS